MNEMFQYERKPEDDYYHILGCDELSTQEQILAEYKVRVFTCHPDKHPDDPTAAQRFARLQVAKDTLTNQETRQKYNQWRRSGVSISYTQWCALRDSVHASMHWASRHPQAMLEEPGSSSNLTIPSGMRKARTPEERHSTYWNNSAWEREETPSQLLKKFRNYEI